MYCEIRYRNYVDPLLLVKLKAPLNVALEVQPRKCQAEAVACWTRELLPAVWS